MLKQVEVEDTTSQHQKLSIRTRKIYRHSTRERKQEREREGESEDSVDRKKKKKKRYQTILVHDSEKENARRRGISAFTSERSLCNKTKRKPYWERETFLVEKNNF